MRKKGLLAVCGALVFVGLATAGAAAPTTPSTSLPVTSPLEGLIATGELPKDVTGQPGEWNFAGPASACPGPGWNCTTLGTGPVVQDGTVNVAQCTGPDCVAITQVGDVNRIECGPGGDPEAIPPTFVPEEKANPIAVQECGPFEQDGDHNIAMFKLIYDVDVGSTQCVLQKGEIDQNGVTNYFKAELLATMTTTTGLVQTQDARQRLVVDQSADESNESEIQEVQVQHASGSATTQNQNTGCVPATAIPAAGDCNEVSSAPVGPTTPYTCVHLTQEVDEGGSNLSKLKQEVKQTADTTATFATETQGTPSGGNDAAVHQEVLVPESSIVQLADEAGRNIGLADQYTYQALPDRSGLGQSQFEDPFCCGGSQFGGDEEQNEETVKQWVQQQADPDALQEAHATGISNSDGPCTVAQNVQNNGGDAQTSQTQDGPCDIVGTTTCQGGVEGFCFSTNCSESEFFNPETDRCEEEEFTETDTITLGAPSRRPSAL